MNKLIRYLTNVAMGLDYFANAITGGDPQETISSRIAKRPREKCPVCHFICKVLDKLDPRHCSKAINPREGGDDVIR